MPSRWTPATVWLLLGPAASVACGAQTRASRDEAPAAKAASASEPAALEEYAFVSARERLRQRPDASAPSIPLDTRRDHVEGWHYPVAVRVIGRAGEYVEVETIAPPIGPLFCGAPHDLVMLSVRGFVPGDALLPATRAPQTLQFEDGTSLSLARGVALHPDADLVEVRGVQLSATIAAADVSSSYAEPGPFGNPRLSAYLRPDAHATYGPHTLPASAFALHREPMGLLVSEVEPVADDDTLRFATIRAGCVSFRVRARAVDLVSSEPPYRRLDGTALGGQRASAPAPSAWESFPALAPGRTLPHMAGVGEYDPDSDLKTRHRVSAGAPVYWPDGAPAGSVGETPCLFHWSPTKRDGKACFELHAGSPRTGVVCFDAADAREEPIFSDGSTSDDDDTDHGW